MPRAGAGGGNLDVCAAFVGRADISRFIVYNQRQGHVYGPEGGEILQRRLYCGHSADYKTGSVKSLLQDHQSFLFHIKDVK